MGSGSAVIPAKAGMALLTNGAPVDVGAVDL